MAYAPCHLHIRVDTKIFKYNFFSPGVSTCDTFDFHKIIVKKCYKVRAYCQEAFTALCQKDVG